MQNNDSLVVPFFKKVAREMPQATKKAGRPIFKDEIMCEVRIAGDRNFAPVFPAHSMWKKVDGEEVTYAQRWPVQFQRFLDNDVQIAEGTPLSELPFLTEAKRQELRAIKVYTAEALASLDGKNLHALGPEGRALKNKATHYLEAATGSAKVVELAEEVEYLKAQLAQLQSAPQAAEPAGDDDEADEKKALKAKYTELSGTAARGNPSVDTLRVMVAEAQAQ